MLPKILYCFWFGPNMSADRLECFKSIEKNSGVSVILITSENLKDYIVSGHPLHRGFKFLSSTHQSDYLRSYFMYHHGGGYTDIKTCNFNWSPLFDQLQQSNKSFIGCPQYSPKHIAYRPYKEFYNVLAGCNNFIFKKQSKFGKLWYEQTNYVMDLKIGLLEQYPGTYHPRAILGGVQGHPGIFTESKYPFKWNELLGQIFHKLQYENLDEFEIAVPFPNIKNYR